MSQFIERLVAVGLHGRFDIDIGFSQGVNVVHGVNGAGKTTLLHILANAANLDLERFTQLHYQTIRLEGANGRVIEFHGQPVRSQSHVSDVSLMIDGHEVETWPPPQKETNRDSDRRLTWETSGRREDVRNKHQITLEATYFPAFRTMIEAWSSLGPSELRRRGFIHSRQVPTTTLRRRLRPAPTTRRLLTNDAPTATALAREVFGAFVPSIDYPSPREIKRQVDNAIQRAVNRLAREDRSLLSSAFTRVFDAISQVPSSDSRGNRTPDEIRSVISKQLERLQSTHKEYGLPDSDSAFAELRSQIDSSNLPGQEQDDTTTRILSVYEKALSQRAETLAEAFRVARDYIDAVNEFLDGKRLVTATEDIEATPRLQIRNDDNTLSQLDTLSSGERQIAGLIYSASHIAQGNVILVDEPELSLHIDWQRKIIRAMVQRLPSKQLIVCTHSPIIASDYMDNMIELVPQPTACVPEPTMHRTDDEDAWPDSDSFEGTE